MKLLICLATALTCMTPVLPFRNTYQQITENTFEDDPFKIHDQKLYNRYLVLNQLMTKSKKTIRESDFNNAVEWLETIDESHLFEAVDINEDLNSMILYDYSNSQYIYAESRDDDNGMLWDTAFGRYVLIDDESQLFLVTDDGNAETLLTITKEDEEFSKEQTASSSALRGSWHYTNMNIHYGSTTGKITKVYKAASLLYKYVAKFSKVPGISYIISKAFEAAASEFNVGDNITGYIEYDSAYMSDCPTYVRQDMRIHKDSYTGVILKSWTRKFHSVRPEDSLPACLAYN